MKNKNSLKFFPLIFFPLPNTRLMWSMAGNLRFSPNSWLYYTFNIFGASVTMVHNAMDDSFKPLDPKEKSSNRLIINKIINNLLKLLKITKLQSYPMIPQSSSLTSPSAPPFTKVATTPSSAAYHRLHCRQPNLMAIAQQVINRSKSININKDRKQQVTLSTVTPTTSSPYSTLRPPTTTAVGGYSSHKSHCRFF